ncbi:MAG: hypothetical protein H0T07_06710 [Actinobacteria bacterium]|nr:hypothetical protein [Actinomycetota bacterium]
MVGGHEVQHRGAAETIGRDIELFVDANGAYRPDQAVRIGHDLVDLGVRWFEEPVSSDDLEGLAAVRRSVDCDVAAGEYGYDLPYFRRLIDAHAVDVLQVDVTRCGGISEFIRVAEMAALRGFELSAHTAPSLHLPLGCAVPNLRHLEYFHDHARLERIIFRGVIDPQQGHLSPDPSRPGTGLEVREETAAEYRVA